MKCLLLISIIFFIVSCEKEEKISFCDEKYDKNEKVIYCLNKENINDFENITKFTNLKKLDLSHSKIKNISLLKELKNLEILYLYNSTFDVTKIIELSFVEQLFILEYFIEINYIYLNQASFKNSFIYIDEIISDKNYCEKSKVKYESVCIYDVFPNDENLKVLKLRINKTENLKYLENYVFLLELWLNFDKYTVINFDYLPKTLKRLVFVESEINNFDFIKDFYNLEEILIVNKNFTKEKILKVKNVTIKYVDPFIYQQEFNMKMILMEILRKMKMQKVFWIVFNLTKMI